MKIPVKYLQLQKMQTDTAAMLALLYSPEGMEFFTEMAQDNFTVVWSRLTTEEAHAILFLLNIAEQIKAIFAYQPESLNLIPRVVFDGFSNALHQLTPYRDLLQRIEARELTPYEVKILAGEIEIAQGQGVSMTMDQLNALLVDAA